MNTRMLNRFLIPIALAALSLFGTAARAQDTPPTPPTVERPAAPTPNVERPETPQVEAPQAATPPAPAEEEPEIVWTRERARGWSRRHYDNRDELVSVGGSSSVGADQRVDEVVSVFGSSTTSGEVRGTVVSVFGDTRVEGGTVGDAAVSVLGDTFVNAPVDGDTVAVMGDVELGPKADVRGNVVIIGGQLIRDPAATVRGGIQHVMGLPGGALVGIRSWLENCARFIRPLAFAEGLGWAWTIALGFLALYAVMPLLFREQFDRCVKTLQDSPGQTILASLLTMLATPVLFFVLAITMIGIVFIPIVSFGMFLATLFGKAVVLAWIGRSVLNLIDRDEKFNAALAVLAGGAIILLLYVVPVLGFIVYNVLGILALGVVVYTLLQAYKARRRNSPPPAFPAGRPTVPPTGSGGGTPAGATSAASASGAATMSGEGWTAAGPAGTGPSATAGSPAGESTPGDATTGPAGGASTAGWAAAPAGAAAGAAFSASAMPGTSGGSGNGGAAAAGPAYATAGGPPPVSVDVASATRAGFFIRMLALLIDVVIIGVVLSILSDSHKAQLLALAVYGAVMWKVKATTVGGIVCNLKVVRLDGREIDWSTAIVRALGCFLSLVVVGLGFLWILIDPGKQAWHDKIAGTAVVRVPQGVSLL